MRSVICLLLPLLGALQVGAISIKHGVKRDVNPSVTPGGNTVNGTVTCDMDMKHIHGFPIREDCRGALSLVLNHTNCEGGKGVYHLKNGECLEPMTVGNCSMSVCAGVSHTCILATT
jgi:hypothetical protein